MRWSVRAEVAAGHVSDTALAALRSGLSAHSAELGESSAGRLAVQMAVEARSVRSAIETAMRDLATAGKAAGVQGRPVAVTAMDWEEHERRIFAPEVPALVSLADIAQIIGVTRQRAGQIVREHPEIFVEVARTANGPLFTRAAAEAFASRDRPAGRPRKNHVS